MFVHGDYLGAVRSVKRPWVSVQFVARPRVKLESTEARAEIGARERAAVRARRRASVRARKRAAVTARESATGSTPKTSTKAPFVDVGSGYSIIQVVVESIIASAKGAVVVLADGCFARMAILPILITIVRIGVGIV